MSSSIHSSQDPWDELFMHALSIIKTLTHLSNTSSIPKPPLKDRINLYGIYKQATEGDINKQEPDSHTDHAAHTKWNSWKLNEGVKPIEAKKKYVKQLILLLNSYGNEYQQVSQLKDTIEMYWNQYNSKTRKYGNITYTPPPGTGAIISSTSILRAHSPAASLYRIASTGINRSTSKLNRSRNGSFSGTTLNTTFSLPIDKINTQQQQQQQQKVINSQFKGIESMRLLSQSTSHSPISNNNNEKSETGTEKFQKFQHVLKYIKLILGNVYKRLNSGGIIRDLLIILLVILIQRNWIFRKTSYKVQNQFNKFLKITTNFLNGRSFL